MWYAKEEIRKYELEKKREINADENDGNNESCQNEETPEMNGDDLNFIDGRLDNLRENLRILTRFLISYRSRCGKIISLRGILRTLNSGFINGAIEELSSNYSHPAIVRRLQAKLRKQNKISVVFLLSFYFGSILLGHKNVYWARILMSRLVLTTKDVYISDYTYKFFI